MGTDQEQGCEMGLKKADKMGFDYIASEHLSSRSHGSCSPAHVLAMMRYLVTSKVTQAALAAFLAGVFLGVLLSTAWNPAQVDPAMPPPGHLQSEPPIVDAAPEETEDSADGDNNVVLFFCILTAKRPTSYLDRVSDAIAQQLTPEVSGLIVDVDGSVSQEEAGKYVFPVVPLTRRSVQLCDPAENNTISAEPWKLPNCKVRQQNWDVATALPLCASHTRPGTWTMLFEDDMVACPNALSTIVSTLGKLDPKAHKTARFAKYSRAIAFPSAESIDGFHDTVRAGSCVLPYDHLLNKQWQAGARDYYSNRGSLFQHIGVDSTIEYRNDKEYHSRYDPWRNENCGDAIQ